MITTSLLVLPIFIVLFLGLYLKRYGFISDDYVKISNRLVFNIFLPSLLFIEISKTSFSNFNFGIVFMVMVISIFTIFALSFIIGNFIKMEKRSIGTFSMNNFRANYAYMGLPVVYYAYGKDGLSAGSLLMAFIVPFVNLLSVLSLTLGEKTSGSRTLFLIKSTLINPIAMSCIFGIIFSISGIHLPDFIMKSLEILSKVALPLALIGIGATINFRYISGKKIYLLLNSFIKLIILPLIAYLILKVLKQDIGLMEKTLIIMLSSPPATVNYVLAAMMNGDTELSSGAIMLSTVLSMFTFIIWLTILGI
ncbi:MAG: AEC family transporter [Calditerrivibrio sp.]|nr:AEC family transporter [Calditerrivibrio sp.]MCA1980080.1 AEC family transporter [Calditerrivibrio sp.]